MYDVVIVGARCAGASLAMLLGRAGFRTLLIDRDPLPSDKAASTHLIWHAGASCLERWGLLDSIEASGCPKIRDFLLDIGVAQLRSQCELRDSASDAAIAPRRAVLDGLLMNEAKAAGVEVRERSSVSDVLREGDRVAGVRITTAEGMSEDIPARLVVGADGINSTLAKLVGAEEYNARDKAQQTYYAYFSGVPMTETEFYSRPGRMGFLWPTNDDQVVAGFCCRMADTGIMREDMKDTFWSEMAAIDPGFAERVRTGTQETELMTAGTRGFFRTAAGPGWALTGDAGLNMDPITAQGITNAFIQAEMLSEAIITGMTQGDLDGALKEFGERRDQALGPMYEFTSQMAVLDPEPPVEIMALFGGLVADQKATDAYFGVFAQTVPVGEFFDPANVARISAGAPAG